MADDAARRAELIEHFGDAVAKHEDVMLECRSLAAARCCSDTSLLPFLVTLPGLSICRLYSLPPTELFFKHEAYLLDRMSKGVPDAGGKEMTRESAREIRAQIQREIERPKAGPSGQAGGAHTPASIRVGGARGRGDVGGL